MSLLKSPMGMMLGFMVIMVFVMPKMMENIGMLHTFSLLCPNLSYNVIVITLYFVPTSSSYAEQDSSPIDILHHVARIILLQKDITFNCVVHSTSLILFHWL
jgi:hypothetical protein